MEQDKLPSSEHTRNYLNYNYNYLKRYVSYQGLLFGVHIIIQ